MPKVRWVISYGFYSKFHTLSSSENILKIGYDLTVTESLKVGTFLETQCTIRYKA